MPRRLHAPAVALVRAAMAGSDAEHPPLVLPLCKGLHTHERALADGVSEHGCIVHVVVPELDAGPVLLQAKVPVLAGDTAETLAARVLEREHGVYVEAERRVAGNTKNLASY